MRGDSRRDLYSKALALCGLGVLAGAGALVDYWPVGIRLPIAVAPIAQPVSSPAAVVMPDDALTVAADLIAAPARRARAAAVAAAAIERTSAPARVPALEPLPLMAVGFDLGTTVHLQALPAPMFVNVRAEAPMWSGDRVRLRAPRPEPLMPPVEGAATDSDGSFLTTAFRKTGSSIVRTGVVTGASVVDAVRVVGSLVRRALPD